MKQTFRSATGLGALRLRFAGFTLIEVMITVAILAIIVAIALPSYTNYVVRTNRAEAQVELLNAASALERCYSRFSRYNSGQCGIAGVLDNGGISSESDVYVVTAGELAATTYSLVATPQGSQATRDTECANFTLTHAGQRGISNEATDVDRCWRR